MGYPTFTMCTAIGTVIWLAVNVADAWWIYFYVQTSVFPVPHTVLNRTGSAFLGYSIVMWMFGFALGIVNLLMGYLYINIIENPERHWSRRAQLYWFFSLVFVGFPLYAFFCIMPFFGAWIITPLAHKRVWNHGCDDYPMFVILDGKAYDEPSYVVNRAYFYSNEHPSSPTHLFTYSSTNPLDGDDWLFALRDWDTPQSDIPLEMYPTLQHVWYDFANAALNGTCALRSSNHANANTTDVACLSGTFDPGNHLSFNITSSVPLNTTLAADAGSVQRATTLLGISDNVWDQGGSAPALKLQQRDPETEDLGHLVLRTTVTRPKDCTELKVCIAGPSGRQGGLVSAEVLAPLGLILMRQADHAKECTLPESY